MPKKCSVLCFLLILGLLLHLPVPVQADESFPIVSDLICYYANYQEAAATDLQRLLEALDDIDPEQGQIWRDILQSWYDVCHSLPESGVSLPDSVPHDSRMCIVVMGFALNANGTMQEELLGRLHTALALAENYPEAMVLCTGGGTASGNQGVTEAGQMARWLEDQGVDKGRILVENRSYSTELNARYSLELLRRECPQVTTLVLVSSDYHLRRCHWLFQTELILTGQCEDIQIAADVGYDAGYVGESGFYAEAESICNLLGLSVPYLLSPELSVLSDLIVDYPPDLVSGAAPEVTVTANYTNGYTRDVTALSEIILPGADKTGVQSIAVTYEENGVVLTRSFDVTVSPPPTTEFQEPQTTAPAQSASAEPTEPQQQPDPESGEVNVPFLILFLAALALATFADIFRHRIRKETQ